MFGQGFEVQAVESLYAMQMWLQTPYMLCPTALSLPVMKSIAVFMGFIVGYNPAE